MNPEVRAERAAAVAHIPTAKIVEPRRQQPATDTWLERRWGAVVSTLHVAAFCALIATIAFHPSLIGRLTSDGDVASRWHPLLYGVEALAALTALALLALARAAQPYSPLKERLLLGVAFCAASLVAGTLLMESGLRLIHTFGRPIQASRHYFFSGDPVLGWRHRPGSVAMFKGTRVEINSIGLRDDEPGSAGRRVLFLGDSQVFGDGVAHRDTFVELLESQIAGIEAINGGVIGYGTDQQLLYFQRSGLRLHPKVTIVGMNAYDLQDNISTSVRSGYQKPLFTLRGDSLALTNVPVDLGSPIDRTQRWLNSSSHLYATAVRVGREPRVRAAEDDGAQSRGSADLTAATVFPAAKDMPQALEVTRLILNRLASEARSAGGAFGVVFLPYRMDLGRDDEYRTRAAGVVDALRSWGETAGYPVLDLRPAFAGNEPQDYFLDAMHFSPAGHQVAARAIGEWLGRTGVIARSTEAQ